MLDTEKITTTIALTALTLSAAYAFKHKNAAMGCVSTSVCVSASPSTPALPKGTKESSFVNSRSQKIHTMQLDPSVDGKQAAATVFFVHGLAEHFGRRGYCKFYERLTAQNCRVFAMDHHGHGRSEGSPRCYCEKFDDYVDDYMEFIEKNWKEDDSPLFVIGQSLGGLIAIFLSARLGDKVKGMILTAPACGVNMDFEKKVQLFLSPVINCLIPKAQLVDAVQPKNLTREKEEMEAHSADPLIEKGRLCARTGIQISNAFAKLSNEVQSQVKCPLLVVHGTADKVTEIVSSEAFFHNTATPQSSKLFVRVPGSFHEIFHEIKAVREPVVEFITNFITSGATKFPEGTVGDKRVLDLECTK